MKAFKSVKFLHLPIKIVVPVAVSFLIYASLLLFGIYKAPRELIDGIYSVNSAYVVDLVKGEQQMTAYQFCRQTFVHECYAVFRSLKRMHFRYEDSDVARLNDRVKELATQHKFTSYKIRKVVIRPSQFLKDGATIESQVVYDERI